MICNICSFRVEYYEIIVFILTIFWTTSHFYMPRAFLMIAQK